MRKLPPYLHSGEIAIEYLFKNTHEIGGNPLFKNPNIWRMLTRDVNTIAQFVRRQTHKFFSWPERAVFKNILCWTYPEWVVYPSWPGLLVAS